MPLPALLPRAARARHRLVVAQLAIAAGVAAACSSDKVVSAGAGSVRATFSTTGVDRDAGYQLAVDKGTPVDVASGGSFVFDGLSVGSHQVAITGVQHNCTVTEGVTRTVRVTANDTTEVAASVTCVADAGVVGHSATDPAADTLPNPEFSLDPAVDIVASSVRYKGDSIVIVLHFRDPVVPASEVAPNSLYGAIEIDADENDLTGGGSVVDYYGGSSGLGVDHFVDLFSSTPTAVALYDVATEQLTVAAMTFGGDSATIRFARADLHGDDGNFAYASIVGTGDRPTDIAPNTGRYVARNPDLTATVAGARVGVAGAPERSLAAPRLPKAWSGARRR